MKTVDVQKCSFHNWYGDFKDVTFESIIIPLPDGFVSYLLKDGIVLPKSSEVQYACKNSDAESDKEDNWEDDSEEPEAPHFPDFDKSIESAIESLGGKVFPKLNWSSPRDASWIALNNSCCCTSVSDVYLLLKSSDLIIHDLTQRFMLCEDFVNDSETESSYSASSETFYLVLKEWIEIDLSGEFRCFVKNGSLIGISQREHSLYFDHIHLSKADIIADITYFFEKYVKHKFQCDNYVFDAYRKKKRKVYLIDFNPFGEVTDSLLFTWEELNDGLVKVNGTQFPEFRCVDNNRGIQPSALRYHGIPKDIIDISTGEDSLKFMDLLKLKIEEQNLETSEDDES